MPDWHRDDRSLPTVIMVAVIVIVIAVLGVLGFRRYMRDERQEESIRKAAEEYNNSMLEARRRKAELEEELAAIREQQKVQIENRGAIVFLCTEADPRVYTDIRPILENAGFVGVIAIDGEAFPGEGGMSTAEMKKLMASGWDTVISARKDTDVRALFERAKAAGLSPKGIYYSVQQADETAEELAKELGVSVVFTYSSDKESSDPSVHRILSLGCNENGIKAITEDNIAASKTMALTIGFQNSRELFDETSVTNMVAYVKKKTDAGSVKVAGVDGAVASISEVERILGEAQKKTEKERLLLEAKIEELDRILITGETAQNTISAETSVAEDTKPAETTAEQMTSVAVKAETEPEVTAAPKETEAESRTEASSEEISEEETAAPAKETEETTAAKKTVKEKKKPQPTTAAQTQPQTTAPVQSQPETTAPVPAETGEQPTEKVPTQHSPVIANEPGAVFVEADAPPVDEWADGPGVSE